MPPIPLPDAERRRRRPVWIALSELWLDTELTDGDLGAVARVLAASGYGDGDLEAIARREVAPVVGANLLVPAGVWSGFDEDWLCERAARLAEGKRRRGTGRLPAEWARLLALVAEARREASR